MIIIIKQRKTIEEKKGQYTNYQPQKPNKQKHDTIPYQTKYITVSSSSKQH